jgi:cytochrome c biogenesis protein CcdA/thiol-disulfide isomerase/thioredoxin
MSVLAIPLAFVAGVITAVSPCVFPVLPIVLGSGVAGSKRRPYAIVAGLATTFFVSVLFATWLLSALGLPDDLLRNISIGLLFLFAATLIFPELAVWIERPLARLTRRPSSDLGGGFLLGCALGFVFTPCAGPALAFVTFSAARHDFAAKTVGVALAYTLGASLVMLGVILGGQRLAKRVRVGAERLRLVFGIVLAAAGLALVFNLDTKIQRWFPDYTNPFQNATEASGAGVKAFQAKKNVTDKKPIPQKNRPLSGLKDYGPAPEFAGIKAWLNTANGKPLTLQQLHGKVVLVDFWTYSCINCLRTLPYLEAWYRTYAKDGFVIVGVHTPEFAFEHEVSNVRTAIKEYGVKYPVAIDDDYGTWNAYGNEYWPAEYLIDANGHVREAKFGEGDYSKTENAIRSLLAERDASLPKALHIADHTPDYALTPETYLGSDRLGSYTGSPLKVGRMAKYTLPFALDESQFSYGGYWNIGAQQVVAGKDAHLDLDFLARKVHLVLGGTGTGTVQVFLNGSYLKTVHVDQDRLYTLVSQSGDKEGRLDLRFSPGVSAYAFTFG